jgi:calmodulin
MRYDTDNSGSIDCDELRDALRKLGLRAGGLETAAVLRRYDADDNGTIDLPEFAVLVRDLQLYTMFDTNCDGQIDASELHTALKRLSMDVAVGTCESLLYTVDPSCEGSLDLQNFSLLIADIRAFVDHDSGPLLPAHRARGHGANAVPTADATLPRSTPRARSDPLSTPPLTPAAPHSVVPADKDGMITAAESEVALASLGIDASPPGPMARRPPPAADATPEPGTLPLEGFVRLVRDLTAGSTRPDRDLLRVPAAILGGTGLDSSFSTKKTLTGDGIATSEERSMYNASFNAKASAPASDGPPKSVLSIAGMEA